MQRSPHESAFQYATGSGNHSGRCSAPPHAAPFVPPLRTNQRAIAATELQLAQIPEGLELLTEFLEVETGKEATRWSVALGWPRLWRRRRLAVIMRRIWVDGTEFLWTRKVTAA